MQKQGAKKREWPPKYWNPECTAIKIGICVVLLTQPTLEEEKKGEALMGGTRL